MMIKSANLFYFFILFSALLRGQNLISNASFEKHNCSFYEFAENHIMFDTCVWSWTSSSYSTPDLIFKNNMSTIVNEMEINPPIHGNNSVGLAMTKRLKINEYEPLVRDRIWGESIQTKLESSIQKDSFYLFSCWLSSNAPYKSFPGFGFSLSDSLYYNHFKTHLVPEEYHSIIESPCSKKWKKYNIVFKAKSPANYLTVGFVDPERFPKTCAYYISIDHISLEKIAPDVFNFDYSSMGEIYFKKGTVLPFFSIFFDNNSFEIHEIYDEQLDNLAKFLLDDSSIKLEIRGLANSLGSEVDNLKLTEERAKVVFEYLLNGGVDSAQLNYIGLGEHSESTGLAEDIRSMRRVDFYVKESLSPEELYLKSCHYGRNENMDSTFFYLKKLLKKGFFEERMLVDPALVSFFRTSKGSAIRNTYAGYFKKNHPNLGKSNLAFELKLRLLEDQLILRPEDSEFFPLERRLTAVEIARLSERCKEINQAHLIFLNKITQNNTVLPKRYDVGTIGMDAIFAIIQHSRNINLLKEYINLFKENYQTDKFLSRYIPFMIDNLMVLEGKPQIYGTQFLGKTGRIYPIKDPDKVNQRRRKMGLLPLQKEEQEKK